MAKKQKEETPNVNATANRDIVQRLNFLYQASIYLQSVVPPTPAEKPSYKGKERQIDEKDEDEMHIIADQPVSTSKLKISTSRKRRRVDTKNTGDLARSYVQSMRIVGQKTTVKMDPSLKRSLCSGCSTTLVAGTTASIRVKSSPTHGHVVLYTCLHCRTTKRIPAPPNADLVEQLDTGEQVLGVVASDTVIPHTQPEAPHQPNPANSRRKKRAFPRPLPLFARRDAGHVVFRGNERLALDDDGLGLGTCFG
ncbi:hypothetical protein GALMADRAFT_216431 [Galerina marginata CBS 339.88]|uniref:Rpr2-domain-containing protein n=1 Tax=Galerina marginata (strain CBS 339.88) TaxID=685588 RepID=A0A067SIQ0_GALM3|nr:hypothetical protein GALMADRAFT_216431 [Galerina marginata CBS 339.88]